MVWGSIMDERGEQEWSEGPRAARKQAVADLMGAGTGSDEHRLRTGQCSRARHSGSQARDAQHGRNDEEKA